jgi:predicted DNA binding CopG/RHH family protein
MKYFILDEEEQRLLKEFERGEWKGIKNFAKEKKLYEAAARNTFNKKRNINIRLSEKDLHKLKVRAAEDGIPYQTLVSSVLHKFANGSSS